jgi:putative spermidine/putrescine transport system substrate-binding protein
MLVVAGCGGSSSSDNGSAQKSVGAGEGKLNIICWASYCEDGSVTKGVDWVTPFEKQTGCQVNVKVDGTSDQMVDDMRSGQYDGVSASGNATAKLVAGGDVAPVNTDLVPNYATVFDDLKNQPYNTFDGVNYGIPHGRGANLLMWRTDDVKPDPTSWSVILDPNQAKKYAGHISVYDDPSGIYIADAAVYLKAHQPDLGITDPYELDDKQFTAAVNLLKQQHPYVGDYWSDYTKQINLFTNGDDQVGTTWQYQYFTLLASKVPVKAPGPSTGFVPTEGATGWSDTWMINSRTKHLNCAYKFIDHIVSPSVNAQIAEYFGEAPGNSKACGLTADPNTCTIFHADDPAFWTDVWYWQTPEVKCVDGRTDVQCKDFDAWSSAWTTIKG